MRNIKQRVELIKALNKTEIIALFGAMCIFLSSIEYLLPKPIPFFRYGLANIVLLLSVRFLSFTDLNLLALLKVLGLAILNGTFASYVFVFSLLGTLSSLYTMFFIHILCRSKVSLVGISIVGAMMSNAVQIVLAVYFIFGYQAWIIAPYLLALGIFSGMAIGIAAQCYLNYSEIIALIYKRYSESQKD